MADAANAVPVSSVDPMSTGALDLPGLPLSVKLTRYGVCGGVDLTSPSAMSCIAYVFTCQTYYQGRIQRGGGSKGSGPPFFLQH